MDNPQIPFRENLDLKKAGASSHMMSTLTHVETAGQQKIAAKTLHGLPMGDSITDLNLNSTWSVLQVRMTNDHACFKLDRSVTARKKVIWSFALPGCLVFHLPDFHSG